MTTITAAEFIESAASWVGVPFHHQGRSRFGVDCAGLPEAVLRDAGVLPEGYRAPRNYGRRPTGELITILQRWCSPIEQPVPGCILAIKFPSTAEPQHIAIYTGSDLIHAYRESTGVVRHAYRGTWPRWTVGAWKLPGVSYE